MEVCSDHHRSGKKAADVLINLDEDYLHTFLEEFTSEELADYLEQLPSDDGADILNQLSSRRREEVIRLVENEEKAGNLLDLLRYEEDVAGGLIWRKS